MGSLLDTPPSARSSHVRFDHTPGRSSFAHGGGVEGPKWVGTDRAGPTPLWAPTFQSGEGAPGGGPHARRGCKKTPQTAGAGGVGVTAAAARGTHGALTVRRSGGFEATALSRPGSSSGFSFELGPRLRNLGQSARLSYRAAPGLRRAAGPGRAGRPPGPCPGSAPAGRSARPAARAGTKRARRPGRSPASVAAPVQPPRL